MHTPLDAVLFLAAAILFGIATLAGILGRTAHPSLVAGGLLAFSLPWLIAAWPG